MRTGNTTGEARRVMEICNACRYCQGYCAVFPAMELRRAFSDGDLDYLANLCHNCRGCYFACQYAPPHEFAINLPQTFAELRMESYAEYAWPRFLGRLFHRNGLVVSVVMAAAIAAVLILTMLSRADAVYDTHVGAGAFYAVIPMGLMVAVAGVAFGFALVAMAAGVVRFWHGTGSGVRPRFSAMVGGCRDALTLTNLQGGGHGCNDLDDGFTQIRRTLHHFLFYGFALCFAATVVAAGYDHLLEVPAPYPFWSWPVQLGTLGGIGMLVGTVGLFALEFVADPEPASPKLRGADTALLFLLFATSATGLTLLAFRETTAMGILLAIHLGFVLALFLAMPYSRFVHGVYRTAALIRTAQERVE